MSRCKTKAFSICRVWMGSPRAITHSCQRSTVKHIEPAERAGARGWISARGFLCLSFYHPDVERARESNQNRWKHLFNHPWAGEEAAGAASSPQIRCFIFSRASWRNQMMRGNVHYTADDNLAESELHTCERPERSMRGGEARKITKHYRNACKFIYSMGS